MSCLFRSDVSFSIDVSFSKCVSFSIDVQEGLSFSPELVRDRTKILGHTGGCFFFTRIGSRPYLNFGRYSKVFLFHPNWFATVPKFWDIQEGFSFSPELVRDRTKILVHRGWCFFHQNWFTTVPKFSASFSKRCFLFKMCFKRSFLKKKQLSKKKQLLKKKHIFKQKHLGLVSSPAERLTTVSCPLHVMNSRTKHSKGPSIN